MNSLYITRNTYPGKGLQCYENIKSRLIKSRIVHHKLRVYTIYNQYSETGKKRSPITLKFDAIASLTLVCKKAAQFH